MIDWVATGQMLSGIGALGGTAAIVVAAILGKNALADYRSQKLVDREIEVAEQALTAAYRAFDAVEHMRGRWIPGHETATAEDALREAGVHLDGMEEKQKNAHLVRGVIYKRADFFKSDFDAIFESIPSAKVYFGQDVVDWLMEFPKARNRMLGSADFLPMSAVGNETQQDRDFATQVRRDVFGTSSDRPDEIRDGIASAIKKLDAALIPKLRPEKESHA